MELTTLQIYQVFLQAIFVSKYVYNTQMKIYVLWKTYIVNKILITTIYERSYCGALNMIAYKHTN